MVVPTYNGGVVFEQCAKSLSTQDGDAHRILVVDSSSTDNTIEVAKRYGFEIESIDSSSFDHGGTRNMALSMVGEVDYVVFLTHDAVLESDSAISKVIAFCEKNNLSAACGKQLPHKNATIISSHAREFNYPSKSRISDKSSIQEYGLKAAFCSNSFAVYRLRDLQAVGGFPESLIFGEDMYAAAKLILSGKKVGYCAEAAVFHSHNYSISQEFRRYFDIGVLHGLENWLLKEFGSVSGEGLKFVLSELKAIGLRHPVMFVSSFIRTGAKLLAYRLGCLSSRLPVSVCAFLSMNKSYWVKSK
ncbi:MAG: glycosyltransferase family 2 protein [Colwellia sp.]